MFNFRRNGRRVFFCYLPFLSSIDCLKIQKISLQKILRKKKVVISFCVPSPNVTPLASSIDGDMRCHGCALVLGALLAALLTPLTTAQTDSKLKGMDPAAMEWLQKQMEVMEEWWCIEQKMLGKAKLCDGYGKTEEDLRSDEAQIRSMMKPDMAELDAMHTAYCGQLSAEARKKAPVCIMWDMRDKK